MADYWEMSKRWAAGESSNWPRSGVVAAVAALVYFEC